MSVQHAYKCNTTYTIYNIVETFTMQHAQVTTTTQSYISPLFSNATFLCYNLILFSHLPKQFITKLFIMLTAEDLPVMTVFGNLGSTSIVINP